jgi:hypothetical protein
MARKRAEGGGRKPRGEFRGKSAALSTRITEATREALDRAAAASGRSLSQEIELRLRHSIAPDEERGTHIKAAGELTKLAAEEIERVTGAHWLTDRFTADAVRHAVDQVLSHFAPPTDAELRLPPGIEQSVAVMPSELGEAYKRPASLGLMEALRLIALIERPREKAPPPNEWSDPFNPDPIFRFWQLHRDLGLNKGAGARAGKTPASRKREG